MNFQEVLIAIAIVGGVGLFIGLFLGFFGKYFKVESDPREDQIIEVLPGNNCGGCGFPGCSGLAAAIVAGEAPVNGCPVGGAKVGDLVAQIMGVEASEAVKKVAFVKCAGTCDKTKSNYDYFGIRDCKMMAFVPDGGSKSCNYGCLGYGTCVKACQFDAISIVDGVAVVDKEKCVACGKCISECPKHLIELVNYDSSYAVSCNSKDKGPVCMKICESSCIGCGLCVRSCESGAISVTDFVAHIDQDKCTGCGKCAESCRRAAIKKL